MKERLRDIHRYWFGALTDRADLPKGKMEIWFAESDGTDAHIERTFGDLLAPAAEIDWDLDALAREEQVALVILLDQFPRNIFRSSGEAFAYDSKACAIARRLIASGTDRFFLVERFFLYLPFQHSERIADQDLAVMLAAELAVTCPDNFRDYARGGLDFATRHRDLIRRFGRFPHRNAMLARKSTDEERAFIAEKGRGY